LATRARRAVRDEHPAPAAPPDNHAKLLTAFCQAASSGDISTLAQLLRDDAIALTDGGGRKAAASTRSGVRTRSSVSSPALPARMRVETFASYRC
jgi:hypothetical protein